MLLKFRSNIFGEFTHYAEIDDGEIKRFVGPLSPMDNVVFKFSIPIIEELQPYFNHQSEKTYLLKVPYDFYYVEGGYIVLHSDGQVFVYEQNITHFKIGNNGFQPIENISYYYFARFNKETNTFIPIGGVNMQFSITNEQEIEEKALKKMEI